MELITLLAVAMVIGLIFFVTGNPMAVVISSIVVVSFMLFPAVTIVGLIILGLRAL